VTFARFERRRPQVRPSFSVRVAVPETLPAATIRRQREFPRPSNRLHQPRRKKMIDPQRRQLFRGAVLAQPAVQVGEIDRFQQLIPVKTAENERFLFRFRVHVTLETLGADFFHHALHRRVDGADRCGMFGEAWMQLVDERVLDRGRHAIRADGDDALSGGQGKSVSDAMLQSRHGD